MSIMTGTMLHITTCQAEAAETTPICWAGHATGDIIAAIMIGSMVDSIVDIMVDSIVDTVVAVVTESMVAFISNSIANNMGNRFRVFGVINQLEMSAGG